jgi:mono/diheme cytochrome c family protein
VAADPVARGEYLVTVGACNDCHTPWTMGAQGPAPDMTRMLSGHPADLALAPAAIPEGWGMLMSMTNTAFLGPWGTSYAANLTPDATGLENVTEAMFVQAMRTNRHFGDGRPILPPMPAPWLGKMTDADLTAIYAYLRTIPPIENVVPDPVPPAGAPAQ